MGSAFKVAKDSGLVSGGQFWICELVRLNPTLRSLNSSIAQPGGWAVFQKRGSRPATRMEGMVWSVRAAARAIFWIIQNFVVGLIVTLAKGVAWCTNDNNVLPANNKPPHSGVSGTASLDEIEKTVNEREEEWKEKFESLWLEREAEKDLNTRTKEIKKLKAALQDEKGEKARLSSLCEQAQKCREEDLARL